MKQFSRNYTINYQFRQQAPYYALHFSQTSLKVKIEINIFIQSFTFTVNTAGSNMCDNFVRSRHHQTLSSKVLASDWRHAGLITLTSNKCCAWRLAELLESLNGRLLTMVVEDWTGGLLTMVGKCWTGRLLTKERKA